jgi:hypothetical protein
VYSVLESLFPPSANALRALNLRERARTATSSIDDADAYEVRTGRALHFSSEHAKPAAMWILVALVAATPLTKTQTAWRSQALTGAARLQELQKDTSPEAKCESALHTAYVLHLTKPELVEKVNEKAEFMHVVLQVDPKSAFDLAYIYDRSKDELVGARVNALPAKWVIAFAESDRILVSDTTGCVYDLDTKKPFAGRVFKK